MSAPTPAQLTALRYYIAKGGTVPVRDLAMVTNEDCRAMLREGWVIGVCPAIAGDGVLSRITDDGRLEVTLADAMPKECPTCRGKRTLTGAWNDGRKDTYPCGDCGSGRLAVERAKGER